MSSPVVTPEDVLEMLMNDGTIDAIRLKVINKLKANEELKNNTITMVEQSKVLNTPGAEKQTKRELFDALRRELEVPVLEKASKAVWELIVDNNGLGREISETVAKAFYKLSGQDPLQFSTVNGDAGPSKENGEVNKEYMDKEMKKEKEKEKGKGKETPESSSRKRKFDDSKTQEADMVATDVPAVSGDSVILHSDLKS